MRLEALLQLNSQQFRTSIADAEGGIRRFGAAGVEVDRNLEDANEGLGRSFGSVKEVIAGVAGALTAGVWATATNDVIQYNTEINQLNQSLLVSRGNLQLWGLVGKQAGVEVADQFKDLAEKIAEFATTGGGEALDFFNRAGLSPDQIKEIAALDPANQILKVGEALNNIKGITQGEKIFLLEGLADDASKLLPYLDNNAAKLKEIDRIAKASGAYITDDQNKVLSDAAKNLSDIQSALTGVKNQAAVAGAELVNAFGGGVLSGVQVLANNMQVLEVAAGTVFTLYAGRGVGALASYAGANLAATASTRARATAEMAAAVQTAQAEAVAADARAIHAAMLLREAEAAVAAATGMARLRAVQTTLLPAQQAATIAAAEATAALSAQTVALSAQASASSVAAGAARGLGAALAFVGGPFGALAIAIAGSVYFLKQLQDEQEKSKDAIRLSSGEWVKNNEITAEAKKLSAEYATASADRRKEIEAETKSLQSNTTEALKNAEAKLTQLKAELERAQSSFKNQSIQSEYDSNGEYIGGEYTYAQAGTTVLQSHSKAIDEQVKKIAELKKQKVESATVSANLGKVYADEATATKEQYFNQEAVTKALTQTTEAETKAVEASKVHTQALQGVIEGLMRQRIAIEQGELAAGYFDDRLKGLSKSEAELNAAGKQTNSYLEARQKLMDDQAAQTKSIAAQYLMELDKAGVSPSALDGIKQISPETEKAVKAARDLQAAMDAASQSATNVATAASKINVPSSSISAKPLGGAEAGNAQQVVGILQKLGESYQNAIAIAANLKKESEFRAGAIGDSGKAYGVAQWHGDRQAVFADVFGKDIKSSSLEEQLRFVVYELRRGNERGAGRQLDAADTVQAKAAAVSQYYERPANKLGEMRERAAIAAQIEAATKGTAVASVSVADSHAKSIPALDQINVKTVATKQAVIAYGGEFDKTRVTTQQIGDLLEGKLQLESDKLIQSAKDHAAAVTQTAYAYRAAEVAAMDLGSARAANILQEEAAANFAEQQAALQKERAGIGANPVQQYRSGLQDQVLDQPQVDILTNIKIGNVFEQLQHDTFVARQEVVLTTDRYRLWQLTVQDGLTPALAQLQLQQERELEHLKANKEAAQGYANIIRSDATSAFQNMADTGIPLLDKVLDKLIESITTSQQFSGIFNSIGGGLSGASGGLLSLFGFRDGGHFDSSGIRAYAAGDTFHNQVLSSPTFFHTPDRQLAVAAEAGYPEAVMPMPRGGILAQTPTGIIDLPVTRVASGQLAVDARQLGGINAYANGGTFQYAPTSAQVPTANGNSVGVSVSVAPRIEIINNTGSNVAVSKQEQATDGDGNAVMRVWLEQVKSAVKSDIAGEISNRRGAVYNALRTTQGGNYA
jgi:hypothetical protein